MDVVARVDGKGTPPIHSEVKRALDALGRSIEKFNFAVEAIRGLPKEPPDVMALATTLRNRGMRSK